MQDGGDPANSLGSVEKKAVGDKNSLFWGRRLGGFALCVKDDYLQ